MAANETPITVVGNLTKDPELRYTDQRVAVVNFTVASTPRVYHRESAEWRDGEPMFLRCTVWRGYAEHVAESLEKGSHVIVTGRLRQRFWEGQDGSKQNTFEVEADEVAVALRWATAKVQKTSRGKSPDWTTEAGPADARPPF